MNLEKFMQATRSSRPSEELVWGRLVIWGGLLAFFSPRRSFKRVPEPGRRPRPIRRISSKSRRLLLLRQAIVGNERAAIEEIFGPPPTVAGSTHAPTWYYPLDSAIGRVVVIEFDGTVARDAQFVDSPRKPG